MPVSIECNYFYFLGAGNKWNVIAFGKFKKIFQEVQETAKMIFEELAFDLKEELKYVPKADFEKEVKGTKGRVCAREAIDKPIVPS